MAQDDSRLPEGTDKVIDGASTTTSASTSSGSTGAGATTATRAGATGDAATGDRVMDKLRTGGEKLSGQAADKARGFVGQGLERSSDALTNVARMISDTADGIDERLGREYGDYARRAGSAIEDAAQRLASKDADELIDDTRDFVRKSPGVALAGAAIVGFALARLVKSGLDRDRDERSADRSGNGDSRT